LRKNGWNQRQRSPDEREPSVPGAEAGPMERKRSFKAIQLLLLLPYLGLLWVPLYNRHDPVLFGFPFFYWYQLLWVPITVLLIWTVYRRVSHED
jgi:hypothetical protein